MGKLIYNISISLDGFMASEDGGLDWGVMSEEQHTFINDKLRTMAAYLNGRRNFELMEEYWPHALLDPNNPAYILDFAHLWHDKPKVVFSRTLERVISPNTRLVRENMVEEVARMKSESSGSMVIGGAQTAAQLMQHGLVDEFYIYINPVVLGRGIPAFPAPDYTAKLKLLETRAFASGVVYIRYGKRE